MANTTIKNFLLVLIGMVCLAYAAHYWYLQRGHIDCMTDSGLSNICAYKAVQTLPGPDLRPGEFWKGAYPPIGSLVASNVLFLVKSYAWMVFIVNSGYLLLLLVSLYALGKEIAGETAGLAAALLILLFPHTYFAYAMYNLDLPLTAAVAFSVCCMVKSHSFASVPWTAAFTAAMAGGLLIKDSFAAFVAGPAAVAGAVAVRQAVARKEPARVACLLASAGAIGAVAYYGYIANGFIYSDMLPRLKDEAGREIARLATTGLWEYQLSPLFFAVFAAGLAFMLWRRRGPVLWQLLLWIIIPNLIVTLMPHWKSVRQVLPAHPAFALIGACGLAYAMDLTARKTVAGLSLAILTILGLAQTADLVHARRLLSLHTGGFRYFSEDKNAALRLEDRRSNEAVLVPLWQAVQGRSRPSVSILFNERHPMFDTLAQYAALRGIECRLDTPELLTYDTAVEDMKKVDLLFYVDRGNAPADRWAFEPLVKSLNEWGTTLYGKPVIDEATYAARREAWPAWVNSFEQTGTVRDRDAVISIYRRKAAAQP